MREGITMRSKLEYTRGKSDWVVGTGGKQNNAPPAKDVHVRVLYNL